MWIIKAYLSGYIPMGIRADALRQEVEENYRGTMRETEAALLLLEKAKQIDREREAVRDAINRLSDGLPRQVLALRYIDGLSWDEVQTKIGYESSQTYALHRKGIKELGRILFAK